MKTLNTILMFFLSFNIYAQSATWEDAYVAGPAVVYDSTSSVYRMWYTGGQGNLLGQIGYATSADGISWPKYENNPVLETGNAGSWDHHAVGFPTVVVIGDTCHMWYAGVSDQLSVEIGYATSTDGINWTKYENNPVLSLGNAGSWEDTWVYMPCVIYRDSVFYMWYTGTRGDVSDYMPWKEQIGYASSGDGKSWIKHPANPVLQVGATGEFDNSYAGGSSVLFQNNIYHMWYYGATSAALYRIGYATSPDGISWQKSASNPVMGQTGWELPRNQDPCVIFSDSTYHMWYSGGDAWAWEIGYATSGDGISWIKYPANPVVTDLYDMEKYNRPLDYILNQNYPNPFNPTTIISYTVGTQHAVSAHVNLSIFNLLGQKVATLVNKQQPVGSYQVQWDASQFASGVYLFRLKAGDFEQTRKLVLLR